MCTPEKLDPPSDLEPLSSDRGRRVAQRFAQRDCWRLDDAVALLLGVAPTLDELFLDRAERLHDSCAFYAGALDLAEMICAAQKSGHLHPDYLEPPDLLHWVRDKKFPGEAAFELPGELTKHIRPLVLYEPAVPSGNVKSRRIEELESELDGTKKTLELTRLELKSLKGDMSAQNRAGISKLSYWLFGLYSTWLGEPSSTDLLTASHVDNVLDSLASEGFEGDHATFLRYLKLGAEIAAEAAGESRPVVKVKRRAHLSSRSKDDGRSTR